jgi:hypothetical protein
VGKKHIAIAASVIVALCGTVSADQYPTSIRRVEEPRPGPEIERSAVRFSTPLSRNGSQYATRVVGTVIDLRQIPVASASLQLRNLDNGTVVATQLSNDEGAYDFEILEPGTFVVEMVLVDGYVIALSNAGAVARYETMQTVVQVPGRWDAGARRVVEIQQLQNYFGVSAATSMTATTIGLADTLRITPADPGVPVSP